MAKFVYVGDSTRNKKGQVNGVNREGAVTYEHPTTGERVKFRAGVPTEAPEWIASRLARNTHFQLVDETAEEPAEPKRKKAKAEPAAE